VGDMSRFRILWGGPYNKLAPTSESVARVQEEREKERRREREGKGLKETLGALDLVGMHTSAYVSIRQHTSTYVSIRQHTPAYASIRQHRARRYIAARA
jgi:hypothetical protein